MKQFLIVMSILASSVIASHAQAQSFCGGTVVFSGDLASNNRAWNTTCCPDGYRVQGIACADLPPDQDLADGCSAVCRSIAKGNRMIVSNDFQRTPEAIECNNSEVFAGVVCKDMSKNSKGDDDVSDSCTAVCQKPGSDRLRVVSKFDIDGNPRQPMQSTVSLPRRVVGIACKDIQKGSSDRLDGCTIIEN